MTLFTLEGLAKCRGKGLRERLLFYVTEEEIQERAKQKIGRRLTDPELEHAAAGVSSALCFGLDTVFDAAIEEAVEPGRRDAAL